MRIVNGTALAIATLLATVAASPVQAQIGGLIKKKAAEAVKGKADPKDDASKTPADSCGPITQQKIQDLLRGLQAEGAARSEFDSRVAKADADREQAEPRVKACRDAENGGTAFQKMLTDGFSGPNPPSTPAAVQARVRAVRSRSSVTC